VGKSVYRLRSGDFVYDTKTHDKGVLIGRSVQPGIHSQGGFELFVWEIYWTDEKHTYYTEEAILNMLEYGNLVIYQNI